MNYSLFALTIGVCAGVFLQNNFSYATEFVFVLLFIFLIEFLFLKFVKSSAESVALRAGFLVLIFGIVLGIVRAQFISEKEIIFPKEKVIVSGVVKTDPVILENVQRINLLTRENFSGEKNISLLVTLPLHPKVSLGENITLNGIIENPKNIFPTPPESVRSFDYKKYLSLQNIYGTMFYPKIISHEGGELLWWQKIKKLKILLSEKLNKIIPSPENKLASGILFGDDTMPKEIKNNFVTSGVSHIIVLSGYNITIFIIFMMMIFLFVPFNYRLALTAVTTILFVVAVGGGSSVIRATLMSLITLLAMYSGREYDAKRALFFSALLMTMYDPKILLYDVSFHLSFLATFGIIFLHKPFINFFDKYIFNKILLETFCVTLSAYLITLPYIVATFSKISLYAILVNILVVPLVPIAMLFSFLTATLGYFSSFIGMGFGYISYLILKFIIDVVSLMSSLPFASINLSVSYSIMGLVYIFGVVFYFIYLYKIKNETLVTDIKIIKNNNQVVEAVVSY